MTYNKCLATGTDTAYVSTARMYWRSTPGMNKLTTITHGGNNSASKSLQQ
eukprot:CAMPEP_0183420480 /NCGR_PEP_ID=MMETSP0370-20130417/26482_1 /TAXON_ID=268820 /ORGANISM="Peridinium aciculiferum, Strain PAER-2" /LENGTH=49 /DNA_ID= /DNA_START= /DNA_END= /DNA_ORIENTATION=